MVCQLPFRQASERLRRRAALFDQLRDVLRMTAAPAEDDTEQDLDQMREQLDELVASFRQRRPASQRDGQELVSGSSNLFYGKLLFRFLLPAP